MKKIIISILILILLCSGCFNKKDKEKDNDKKDDIIENSYIETVPESAQDFITNLDNTLILSIDEIKEYNKEIKSKTDTMFDLDNINKISKEEILKYINSYTMPSLPKYNKDEEIKISTVNEILENRNIDTIQDNENIIKGIIVNRSNLRSFPTNIHFYDEKNIEFVDNLQESELHINTPVLILHESKDKKWYFVLTKFYAGWVKEEDVALANKDDFNYFINNSSFGIITDSKVQIGNTVLDMSVKLPYVGVNERGYEFSLPIKDKDGYVDKTTIIIPRDKAHLGYLPYTKRNIYIEAFKYENVKYSWGGMDSGVDCSSYVANIYRTFGIEFPRNTSSQKDSVGEITYLNGKTIVEKKKILNTLDYPSLIYMNGHVMIYLGKKDNKDYIIHASGSDKKVVLEELTDDSMYLQSIDRVVLVK